MSRVTCHVSLVTNNNGHNHRPSPSNSLIIHSIISKLTIRPSNRSFFDLRKWVFLNGTNRQKEGHGNSMTNSAQRAELVKKDSAHLSME